MNSTVGLHASYRQGISWGGSPMEIDPMKPHKSFFWRGLPAPPQLGQSTEGCCGGGPQVPSAWCASARTRSRQWSCLGGLRAPSLVVRKDPITSVVASRWVATGMHAGRPQGLDHVSGRVSVGCVWCFFQRLHARLLTPCSWSGDAACICLSPTV